MSLTKWNNETLFPSFPSWVEDFFGKSYIDRLTTGTTIPAVNIHEADDHFEIEVAAPGFEKKDFNVKLEDDVLTISAEKRNEQEDKNKEKRTSRREFSYSSFSRSFTLPHSVNIEKIDAQYKDGLLCLNLPKKEQPAKQAREINIT